MVQPADHERHRVKSPTTAQYSFIVQLKGQSQPWLEVVFIGIPKRTLSIAGKDQAAFNIKVGDRNFGNRAGRIRRFGCRFDRTGGAEIEIVDVAIVALIRRAFVFVAQAQVERQLLCDTPIIVEEHALIERLIGARGIAFNRAAGGLSEQEGRQLLANRAGG